MRDDYDKFLFDVSTVPHKQMEFTDVPVAIGILREELENRIKEQSFINDARLQLAVETMSTQELHMLGEVLTNSKAGKVTSWESPLSQGELTRLLDKQLLKITGTLEGVPYYCATPFGQVVCQIADAKPKYSKPEPPAPPKEVLVP